MSVKILMDEATRKAVESMESGGTKGNTPPRVIPVSQRPQPSRPNNAPQDKK